MQNIQRTPWHDFPDVLIHAEESAVKQHPCYAAAKAGGAAAAVELVNATLDAAKTAGLVQRCNAENPILVSVHAEEAMGRNAIPEVMADAIASASGWQTDLQIVQANVVNHTGANGFVRLARQAVFSGVAQPGRNYVIVDDFVGQGGTIANLKGWIESQGGQVTGAVVLTGKPYSAKITPSSGQIAALRSKHGQIEDWWRAEFGFGFDFLTESEARYLVRSPDVDTIRNRILAAA